MEFYCVRCKEKVEQGEFGFRKTANKRTMAVAECPVCGARMSRFVSKDTEEKEKENAAS